MALPPPTGIIGAPGDPTRFQPIVSSYPSSWMILPQQREECPAKRLTGSVACRCIDPVRMRKCAGPVCVSRVCRSAMGCCVIPGACALVARDV